MSAPSTAPVRPPTPVATEVEIDSPPTSVLFLSVGASSARNVKNHAAFLLSRGVEVELVTANPEPWRVVGLDPRVTLHSLRAGEGRHPLPRTERLLVYRLPGKLLDVLWPLARHPRHGRTLEIALLAARRAHRGVADAFHKRFFIRLYRVIRPYLMWRVARGIPRVTLDPGDFDRLAVWDTHSVPIAWHLARRFPNVEVTLGIDRAQWRPLPIHDPAVDPERALSESAL